MQIKAYFANRPENHNSLNSNGLLMPGNILKVNVVVGQAVKEGDVLVILEAMKMENEIMAPQNGTVTQILVDKGATVETGAPLVCIR